MKPPSLETAFPGTSFLVTQSWPDYALLDMGNGQKLERYGPYKVIRPEPQALGKPSLTQADWQSADAIFSGISDNDDESETKGRWQFGPSVQETWPMEVSATRFFGRFTSFRHMGVFPEQAAHWQFMEKQIKAKDGPFKLLNLFGYTGVASLIAAAAGAHVTHVDASKKAIGWARENQELAGLSDKPIRWICDDAVKFAAREIRRGNHYDGILLDPPKFGRGPKGEPWHLFENLPALMDDMRQLLTPKSSFLVLTAYSIRASFVAIDELTKATLGDLGGRVESGELLLKTPDERYLSTSMFSRWVRK